MTTISPIFNQLPKELMILISAYAHPIHPCGSNIRFASSEKSCHTRCCIGGRKFSIGPEADESFCSLKCAAGWNFPDGDAPSDSDDDEQWLECWSCHKGIRRNSEEHDNAKICEFSEGDVLFCIDCREYWPDTSSEDDSDDE